MNTGLLRSNDKSILNELAGLRGILQGMYFSKTEAMLYIPRYELEYLVANNLIQTKQDKKRKWLCNAFEVIKRAGYKTIAEKKRDEEDRRKHKTQS